MNATLTNNSLNQSGRPSRTPRRDGAVVVEFALVAPLLMLLILGAIDVGQCANVYQKVSDASRKGARVGARFDTLTTSDVEAAVLDFLKESTPGASPSTIAAATVVRVTNSNGDPIPGGDLTTVPAGSQIRVQVTLQFDPVRWVDVVTSLDGSDLAATTMMRRE